MIVRERLSAIATTAGIAALAATLFTACSASEVKPPISVDAADGAETAAGGADTDAPSEPQVPSATRRSGATLGLDETLAIWQRMIDANPEGVSPEIRKWVADGGVHVSDPNERVTREVAKLRKYIATLDPISPLEVARLLYYGTREPHVAARPGLFALQENGNGMGPEHRTGGRPPLLMEYLDQSIEDDPRSIEALRLRAEAHRFLRNYPGAFADLERVIQIDPENAAAHVQRAEAHLRSSRELSVAIPDLQRALELGLDRSYVHRLLAIAYRYDDPGMAVQHLRKALEYGDLPARELRSAQRILAELTRDESGPVGD